MSETYHIEALGYSERGKPPVVQRLSLRSDGLDRISRRAVLLLRRSTTSQWNAAPVEAVRVVDGAGSELFRWSVWDEMSGAR